MKVVRLKLILNSTKVKVENWAPLEFVKILALGKSFIDNSKLWRSFQQSQGFLWFMEKEFFRGIRTQVG